MRWIAATAVLVMLAGCATSEPTDTGPEDGSEPEALAGTEWVLAEGVPVVAGYPITLRVEDGEVRGTAACNTYSATVVITGDALEIGDIAVTEMGCPEPGVHDSEAAYLGALQAVERYEHEAGRLLLSGPGVELRFEAATPVEDAPLTGTDWQLESLVTGSGPDGTVSSTMADATLRLDDDGTMRAFDGCNELAGRWVLGDDGVLVVSEVVTTDVACPSLADQVEHISEVLVEATPVVTVEGARLVLTAGERALDFRAP